jgi:hypothetical protein
MSNNRKNLWAHAIDNTNHFFLHMKKVRGKRSFTGAPV